MAKSEKKGEIELALTTYASLAAAIYVLDVLACRQLGGFGLTMGQFRVLEALARFGPMNQSALCDKVFCRDSNMTMLVGNLAKRGWVVRGAQEADKRERLVELTPEGKKAIVNVFPAHARLVRAQMVVLKVREQEALCRICAKLGSMDLMRFSVGLATARAMVEGLDEFADDGVETETGDQGLD